MQHLTLIDSHVHIHSDFDLRQFISSAFSNFGRNARKLSSDSVYEGVLCLTESKNENYFSKLVSNKNFHSYKISVTNEENSLICFKDAGEKIFIIAGRQIVTKEKLEILGLGINEIISDGLSIRDVISLVLSKDGLPVIPWGVGKWVGNRGKIVNELLDQKKNFPLFLGDNSNRPFFWPKSNIFKIYERNINLPGTDPLPFKSEESRAGDFGFYINEQLSDKYPFKDLKEKIFNSKNIINYYGKLESPFRFFVNQIRMQIKKNKQLS